MMLRRIVLVRLAQEGEEGKYVYKEMINHLWADVDVKSKKLGVWYVTCWCLLLQRGWVRWRTKNRWGPENDYLGWPFTSLVWRGQVWYRGTMSGRSLGCFIWILPKRSIPMLDTRKRYCTARVDRHWHAIGTDEQEVHKISHWTDKYVLWCWLVSTLLYVPA